MKQCMERKGDSKNASSWMGNAQAWLESIKVFTKWMQ